jgi:proteasome alpha subunit
MVKRDFQACLDLGAAVRLAVSALAADGGPNAARRELGVEALEVAILDRTRALPRKFRRIRGDRLAALLVEGAGAEVLPPASPPTPAEPTQ